MMPFSFNEIIQLTSWLLALVEGILAFYMFFLNIKNTFNRQVGITLLILAVNTFGLGLIAYPQTFVRAQTASIILAATIPATQPILVPLTISILQDNKKQRLWQWISLIFIALSLVPFVLTGVDFLLHTNFLYSGLSPDDFEGVFVQTDTYLNGSYYPLLRTVNMMAMPIITAIIAGFLGWFTPDKTRRKKIIAGLLIISNIFAIALQFGLRQIIAPPTTTIVTIPIYVVVYLYASIDHFTHMKQVQGGKLQVRLATLMLSITIPLLLAITAFIGTRAGDILLANAEASMESSNVSLGDNVSIWIRLNSGIVSQLAATPAIKSMDPAQLNAILLNAAENFPGFTSIQVLDLDGNVIANSQTLPRGNFEGEVWFRAARRGIPLHYETAQNEEMGYPVFVISAPILDQNDDVIGVLMAQASLDAIRNQIAVSRTYTGGVAYVVDEQDRIVAHSNPEFAFIFADMSDDPAVKAMRVDYQGIYQYTDKDGVKWRASVNELDNGWGIVIQQRETDLLFNLRLFQTVSWAAAAVGIVLLITLTSISIRQAIRPIGTLTDTAKAIAEGDLEKTASVETEDEIGTLATVFNQMTAQLKDLIGSLEYRVNLRTRELEERNKLLEAAAETAHAAASILDPDRLINEVVEVIRDRFNLYYVGLFLVDEFEEWAVLKAGTGEAGKKMIARGHRIRIGEGMIGWSIENNQARIALEAGADTVRLATEELPLTRSEASIPLRSRGKVIGALTVQSEKPGAFDEITINILQAMADQVALALDNASLFAESQAAIEAARRAYGELSFQAWRELLSSQKELAYHSDQKGTRKVEPIWRPEMAKVWQSGSPLQIEMEDQYRLAVPVLVRNNVIGVLNTYKPKDDGPWSSEEIDILENVALQLGTALESARLFAETQARAQTEKIISDMTQRFRESLQIDRVLESATRELSRILDDTAIEISLDLNHDNQ